MQEVVKLGRPAETAWSWAVCLAALAALIAVGYFAFLAFARGAFEGTDAALVGVAAVAGVASFFSPCSFPFLPSYLSFQAVRPSATEGRRLASAAGDGVVAGLGVVGFNVILGSVVGVAGAGFAKSLALLSPTPSSVTVAVRLLVAGALVALGLLQVFGRAAHSRLASRIATAFQRLARPSGGRLGLFLYGFAYTAIGIGCTGPFLASVVFVALAAGGLVPAILAFVVFALTMAGLMVAVSLIAAATPLGTRALVARAPRIKRVAGATIVGFGLVLAAFTLNPYALRPLFP